MLINPKRTRRYRLITFGQYKNAACVCELIIIIIILMTFITIKQTKSFTFFKAIYKIDFYVFTVIFRLSTMRNFLIFDYIKVGTN
jgi:hypothetical protein